MLCKIYVKTVDCIGLWKVLESKGAQHGGHGTQPIGGRVRGEAP